MKFHKKCQAWLLTGLISCSGVLSLVGSIRPLSTVHAEEVWPSDITLSDESEAAIVMDVDTGTILYSHNEHDVHYPASITKIMTALIALENTSLNETVTFSKNAVYGTEAGSSSIARDVDEQMTMEQTLYGMMLESANECATAIAEHVGGDVPTFTQMMNEKAASLGCQNTHFNNANGLPDENHYTSAYDMALIARAAFQNQVFAQITGTKTYQIPPTNKHSEITYLNNHHAMLNYYKTRKWLYEYCAGGKTGYTVVAKNTLVTYAKKDGMTLVCVIMYAPPEAHYRDTIALFDYCFDNFTTLSVKENANLFSDQAKKDAGALSKDLKLVQISNTGSVILPKTVDFSAATANVIPLSTEDANVIGKIEYTYANRYVGGAELLYTEKDAGSVYPFHNLSPEEGGSTLEYYQVDFKWIFKIIGLVLLGLIVLMVLFVLLHRFMQYKYRYIDTKRKAKSHYRSIKKSRRKPRKGRKIL